MSELGAMNDEQKNLIQYYKQTFTTPSGAKVLEDLKVAFMSGSTYNPTYPQPHDTFIREGNRQVVESIVYMMNYVHKEEDENKGDDE